MEFAIVATIIICGWLFLCVLSEERERSAQERALREQAQAADEISQLPLDTAKN